MLLCKVYWWCGTLTTLQHDITYCLLLLLLLPNIIVCIPTEFIAQGDEEQRRGMQVTPLFDREQVNIAISQGSFLEFFVKPCYESIQPFAPNTTAIAMKNIEINLLKWKEI